MVRKDADHSIVAHGSGGSIEYAVCANGQRPAEKFIRDLPKKRSARDQMKLLTLLTKIADGQKLSDLKFKHLQDGIYEFKSGQIRVLCFRRGDDWYLTHGFIKKQDKCPPKEILKAKRIRDEHLSWV